MSKRTKPSEDRNIVGLDYDQKVKMLEQVVIELLEEQENFVETSAQYARSRAKIALLKERRSALQSAIKAEGMQ